MGSRSGLSFALSLLFFSFFLGFLGVLSFFCLVDRRQVLIYRLGLQQRLTEVIVHEQGRKTGQYVQVGV